MSIKLHVSQKVTNEDGTTTVVFVPILVNGTIGTILSGGNLTLTLATLNDTFIVGKNYDGSFAVIA
jgi:hypothetical protein